MEKNLRKIMRKSSRNKLLESSFDKRHVGKISYKTKIFITKIYSNIDKFRIIFALLASFDTNRAKARES